MVALIAKHVGFRGPIIGWAWIRGPHKIPEWWPWEPLPEARQRYLVPPDDQGPKTSAGSRSR